MKIFYLCDRRACEKCSGECKHTEDVRHAVNFEMQGDAMEEVEVEVTIEDTIEVHDAISEERLAKIKECMAKLVDANRKTIGLPQVSIKCDSPAELAAEIGRMTADGIKAGLN